MNKEQSKWQTRELARIFSEGVLGAIPGARIQLEIFSTISNAQCPLPARILDLGYGDGLLGRMLLEEFPAAHMVFADFSEPMLEKLRGKIGSDIRATVINLDFATPDWLQSLGSEKPFDIIVSGFALRNQPDERKRVLYGEIYGLLNSGGLFLNLDQVSSASPSISEIFDSFFLDHIRSFHTMAVLNEAMLRIEAAYYQDKKENIPAPVESQCQWLRETGFQEVDCFFKTFELALFGGRKISQS